MNKKLLLSSICVLLLLTIISLIPACESAGETAPDKVIRLRFQMSEPTTSPAYVILKEWESRVEDQTGGKVDISIYGQGTFYAPFDAYEALLNGVVEIASAPTGYSAARLPLNSGIGRVMTGATTSEQGTRAYWDLYEKYPQFAEEYDAHVICTWTTVPMIINSRIKCSTFEDFEDMQIRTPPDLVDPVEALGCVPVSISMEDAYLNLEKGIIDGWCGPLYGFVAWNLSDVTSYAYPGISVSEGIISIAINNDTWNALPKDVQEVFDDLNLWLSIELARASDIENVESLGLFPSLGCELIELPPGTEDTVFSLIKPTHDAFAADLEAEGIPGYDIVADAYELLEQYK